MSPRRVRLPALALDDLEAWLVNQPDIARRNWTVSSINGFCAALVVGPERIATEAWLRVIFGPSLPVSPMGLAAVKAVLITATPSIATSTSTEAGAGARSTCAPTTAPSSPSAGPRASCSQSSAGRPRASHVRAQRPRRPLLPIIACSEAEEVEKLIAGRPQEVCEHVGRAYHHIPEAICAIRNYWRKHPTPR